MGLLPEGSWLSVYGIVWGGLEMCGLAEGSTSLSLGMDFEVTKPRAVRSICSLLPVVQSVNSQLAVPAAVLPDYDGGGFLSLGNCEPK